MAAAPDSPTIEQALAEFLETRRARLASSTYRKYEEIVELLGLCLNEYGHQGLGPTSGAGSRRPTPRATKRLSATCSARRRSPASWASSSASS